jgi:hypothetical protein
VPHSRRYGIKYFYYGWIVRRPTRFLLNYSTPLPFITTPQQCQTSNNSKSTSLPSLTSMGESCSFCPFTFTSDNHDSSVREQLCRGYTRSPSPTPFMMIYRFGPCFRRQRLKTPRLCIDDNYFSKLTDLPPSPPYLSLLFVQGRGADN